MAVGRATLICATTLVLAAKPALGQLSGRCFDATLGTWSRIEGTHRLAGDPAPPPDQSLDSLLYAFPPRLLLSDLPPRRGGEDWRRVEVPDGALPVPKPFQRWRVDGDSLQIFLGDGFTSASSTLRRDQGRWHGILRTRSDNMGTQLYSRPIELRETACASPPPALASADVPAPRMVPSSSGPPIVLAQPVPEVYAVQPLRRLEWVVGPRLSGYWAGSDSVFVRRNRDGLVSQIDIRYPEGFDATALEDGLRAEFGSGRPDAPWLSWWNRSTRASLQAGGRVRVLLIDPRMRY